MQTELQVLKEHKAQPAQQVQMEQQQLKDKPTEQLFIWRLLVDARHQGRGFGGRAIAWILEEARRMGLPTVGLSHGQEAGHAGPFYEKLGFSYTGEVDDDELKMVYTLGDAR